MQSQVNPYNNQRDLRCPFVNLPPRAACLERDPENLCRVEIFGNDDAAYDNHAHREQQNQVEKIVDPCLTGSLAKEAPGYRHHPRPAQLENLRDSAIRLSQGELSHRVTEQRQDEIGAVAQAFNQMATRVQAMIEEQRAFASNTSHELRTPLTTMRLRTEALRFDKELDPATIRQYAGELDDELVRLSALVDDLVLLSRFDARRAEIGQEQIDLTRFAHSLIQSMSQQARSDEISLALDAGHDEPLVVNASLNHLTVLFRNLLDNAIKYTPSGGVVTWRLRRDGDKAILSVTDTGQGIAPEYLPHIFERFYRADRARSRSIPGTGLGLALAQSIIETYGASISAESPGSGRGTTITVRWPLADSKSE